MFVCWFEYHAFPCLMALLFGPILARKRKTSCQFFLSFSSRRLFWFYFASTTSQALRWKRWMDGWETGARLSLGGSRLLDRSLVWGTGRKSWAIGPYQSSSCAHVNEVRQQWFEIQSLKVIPVRWNLVAQNGGVRLKIGLGFPSANSPNPWCTQLTKYLWLKSAQFTKSSQWDKIA